MSEQAPARTPAQQDAITRLIDADGALPDHIGHVSQALREALWNEARDVIRYAAAAFAEGGDQE